jgi:hypothetical protein
MKKRPFWLAKQSGESKERTNKKMKYLLIGALALTLSGVALADGYFHGSDSNGNSWHGYTDSDGYFQGSDSNGNSWHGYMDSDGYFQGSDSDGDSWHGWAEPQ